jgi:acetyl/propionyl-CoA carboxylase alpha subunit
LDWGVNAIHPGYGFLSENEEFCGAVEAAGIVWLGPSAKTLHDFALKHVAREIAEKAGVSGADAALRTCRLRAD